MVAGSAKQADGKAKAKAKSAVKKDIAKAAKGEARPKTKKTGPYEEWKGQTIPMVDAKRGTKGSFTAISWNIAGLRTFMEKRVDELKKLVKEEDPAVLSLLEIKLQDIHVKDMTAKLSAALPDYDAHFTISTVKKGYSGVCSLVKKSHKVLSVEFGLGKSDPEGRVITLQFKDFFVVTVYTPNSGMKLERLDYRINTWDKSYRDHLSKLSKPVIAIGDFNAAHLDVDIYNVEAPHTPKSAGTTPEERESFGRLLRENELIDTWRHMHGQDTLGHFTYWSVRAKNRGTNRGLRLDYCLVSKALISKVNDAFTLPEFAPNGDHGPVGVSVA